MKAAGAIVRMLIFFMSFTLEVRVHAAESAQLPLTSSVFQQPENCLVESSTCAIGTPAGSKYKLSVGETIVWIDQSSTVVRTSPSEIRLVAGTIWVQAKGEFTVKSEFGLARVRDGEFWVTRDKDRMTVAATGPQVELLPRGSNESLFVLAGMENSVGRVTPEGVGETELPQAIAFDAHIRRWARLYSGKKKQFQKDVKAFHAVWSQASEQVAAIHRELHDRKIASIEEAKARKLEQQKRVDARNRELRAMLLRKVESGE